MAVAMKMNKEVLLIAESIPLRRPNVWTFTDPSSTKDAFTFIAYSAVRAAAKSLRMSEHELLPTELSDVGARVPAGINGGAFEEALKAELQKLSTSGQEVADNKSIGYETRRDLERFIDQQLGRLHELAQGV